MSRIFLTGGGGFIGSALAQHWAQMGHEVWLTARFEGHIEPTLKNNPNIHILVCDLENLSEELVVTVKAARPDVFCHTAWQGTSAQDRDNLQIQWAQLNGFRQLLKLADEVRPQQFILLGSQAECRPSAKPLDELTPIEPQSAYGAAKTACYLFGMQWSRQSNIPFAHVRLLTVYGPGDRSQRIVPYLCRSALTGISPELTLGEQVWDFLFIDDLLTLLDRVVEQKIGGLVLAAAGNGTALRDVAIEIERLTKTKIHLGAKPYRKNELMFLLGNSEHAKQKLGWIARTSIKEGLAQTIDWWKQNLGV